MMVAETLVPVMAIVLAYFVCFEDAAPELLVGYLHRAVISAVFVSISYVWFFGLDQSVLRYVGITVMTRPAGAGAVSLVLLTTLDSAVSTLFDGRSVPFGVLLVSGMFAFIGRTAIRSVGRM